MGNKTKQPPKNIFTRGKPKTGSKRSIKFAPPTPEPVVVEAPAPQSPPPLPPPAVRVDRSPHSANVLNVRFDVTDGWEQYILLRADAHQDNLHCRRDIEERHLQLALKRNALIADFGDLFCAMQGRGDPRASYSALRTEHKGDAYLDLITKDASDRYKPYSKNWLLLARGNHETSVLKHHSTDLTSNLAMLMNLQNGGNVTVGGYGGYIRLLFNINQTRRSSILIKYFHGAGGGGPVTKGIIDLNRQAVMYPDCDVLINGHVHEQMVVTQMRERLSEGGRVYMRPMFFVRLPTYKDEYGHGEGGYHVERGRGPKPIGAVMARFWYEHGIIQQEYMPLVENFMMPEDHDMLTYGKRADDDSDIEASDSQMYDREAGGGY